MARKKANKSVVKSVQKNINKNVKYQERTEKMNRKNTRAKADELPLLINPEDTEDNPLTYERLMNWLAGTGWVYGYVRKRISPMDAHLYEDYAQSVWIEILNAKPERLMEVWHNGKGAFINYLKVIIDIQLKSFGSTYKTNKQFYHNHHLLSDEQWHNFEEGNESSTYIDTYPVKYTCPSGNRKKMVVMEHEELPIHIDNSEYSLYE